MNLSQLLLILKARRKTVILTMVVTVLLTIAVSLVMPKTYEASTSLVLNFKGSDPVTGAIAPPSLSMTYLSTQTDIIQSKGVAMGVVDRLHLADSPEVKENFLEANDGKGDIRDWLASLLLKNLRVMPARDTMVVEVVFKGSTPEFAAAVVNAFAAEYLDATVKLRAQPLVAASAYFNKQIKSLGGNLEAAQAKLSKYQQEKGLVSVDNRLDVETARLNDLSTQLVVVQNQLMEASSRQTQGQGDNASESPDIVGNPLVQNLKVSLAIAESKFSEVAQRVDVNHPTYQASKAEVEKLRAELQKQIATTSSSLSSNSRILQRREAELRASLEAQKARVLELNRARDELAVMMKEVESAQRAYDLTTQRLAQTNLEGQANQTDVAILSPAVPPTRASSPKIVLNTALSVFLGAILGVGIAIAGELTNRLTRSADDLNEVLGIPVLASLGQARPKRKWYAFRRSVPAIGNASLQGAAK